MVVLSVYWLRVGCCGVENYSMIGYYILEHKWVDVEDEFLCGKNCFDEQDLTDSRG